MKLPLNTINSMSFAESLPLGGLRGTGLCGPPLCWPCCFCCCLSWNRSCSPCKFFRSTFVRPPSSLHHLHSQCSLLQLEGQLQSPHAVHEHLLEAPFCSAPLQTSQPLCAASAAWKCIHELNPVERVAIAFQQKRVIAPCIVSTTGNPY
jgi:hypothetical protein